MKNNNLFLFETILLLVICLTGCSKEEENKLIDPVGTVKLNMMMEGYGQTELGNSDVYINNAYNFCSTHCLLSNLGKKEGLGSISEMQFTSGTSTAAVEPGYAYQIFNMEALKEFPSGKPAFHIQSDYYNVFVDSEIKEEDTTIGAIVKFILMDIPDNGLPPYNTYIGTLDHLDGSKFEIEVELPSPDFEYEPTFGNALNEFEHKKEGNNLVVRLIQYNGFPHEIGFYIRVKDSYTYVYGNVK